MLTGCLVAIVTPMNPDESLDLPALKRLIDWHVNSGTKGIVIVGTTGESPTVSHEEHRLLIKSAVEFAGKRIAVIAGAGSNSTREAIEMALYAKSVGVDYHLSVVPYYNRPSQEGLFHHFASIAAAVDLPMLLYNVPGRTIADLADDTTLRLAQLKNIVGIKDATGNIARAQYLVKHAPAGFALYSGDDATTVAFIAMGGHGTISVTANVAPQLMSEMCANALAGQFANAIRINNRLMSLHKQLFCEPSPAPTKWALAKSGLIHNALRTPILALTPASQALVASALQEAGISVAGE